jgi:PrgI family protein
MRFQVPQFIEIEDKIVGPLTLKQFMYLAGGAGMIFVAYKLLPFIIAIVVIAFIAALSLALSFYKVNNRPFIDILESAFNFYIGDRLYIWKKVDKKIVPKEKTGMETPSQVYVPRLSDSKLKELSWSLDINENLGQDRGSKSEVRS